MKHFNKGMGFICAVGALTGLQTAAANSLDALSELAASSKPGALQVSFNDADKSQWRVGESVKLHFISANDCNLQAIHVDANGVASVFELGEIKANEEAVFPKGVDFMSIEPPLGRDNIFAVCSKEALPSLADLRLPHKENVIEAKNVGILAERYAQILADDALVARYSYSVNGRDEQLALASNDIVDFYTKRTRTIKRPKLDLNVKFDFRSADLTDDGKALLDEMGKALQNNRMLGAKFELNGHTDDIGSDSYNMTLSSKRAIAVAEYLKSQHNVEAERVIPKGYGESSPKVENTDDESRAENRRVEFQLVRDE